VPRSTHPIGQLGVLLLLALAAGPAGATSYTLSLIAPPTGATAFNVMASGYGDKRLNNSGQIIGSATIGTAAAPTGYLRNANGSYTPIGGATATTNVTAIGLNASGQVVGYSALGGSYAHAVRWTSGGAVQDLGTYGGQLYSRANAINAGGTVVGYGYGGGADTALLWSASGNVQSLGIAGQAKSINASGQVAGITADGRGFLWSSGSATQYLNAPSGYNVRITGINDLGQVAGYFLGSRIENDIAFVWSGGTNYTQIGSADEFRLSYTTNNNNLGQNLIMMDDVFGLLNYYVWTEAAGLQAIESPLTAANGWSNVYLTDINDLGQILGIGVYNSAWQTFLLNPVPAPAGLALFATGLLGLGLARRFAHGAIRAA